MSFSLKTKPITPIGAEELRDSIEDSLKKSEIFKDLDDGGSSLILKNTHLNSIISGNFSYDNLIQDL